MDYGKFVDKIVDVTLVADDDSEPIVHTGKVISGSESGLYMQITSSREKALLEADEIEHVRERNISTKRLLRRYLSPQNDGQVRQHLADRHGMPLDIIPNDLDEAMELHAKVDHERLGHAHGERPTRQRRERILDRLALVERAREGVS